jgi:hypothetical protein
VCCVSRCDKGGGGARRRNCGRPYAADPTGALMRLTRPASGTRAATVCILKESQIAVEQKDERYVEKQRKIDVELKRRHGP